MPFTECPKRRSTVYSAAAHSTRDACPACGAELRPGRRRIVRSVPLSRVREQARRLESTASVSLTPRATSSPGRRLTSAVPLRPLEG